MILQYISILYMRMNHLSSVSGAKCWRLVLFLCQLLTTSIQRFNWIEVLTKTNGQLFDPCLHVGQYVLSDRTSSKERNMNCRLGFTTVLPNSPSCACSQNGATDVNPAHFRVSESKHIRKQTDPNSIFGVTFGYIWIYSVTSQGSGLETTCSSLEMFSLFSTARTR